MATVYKIRNKQGLYSTGGAHPTFTKSGKTWKTKGALNNHFNVLFETDHWRQFDPYNGCELVEIEVLESEKSANPVSQWAKDRRIAFDKRNEDRARKLAEWNKEYRKLLESKPKF